MFHLFERNLREKMLPSSSRVVLGVQPQLLLARPHWVLVQLSSLASSSVVVASAFSASPSAGFSSAAGAPLASSAAGAPLASAFFSPSSVSPAAICAAIFFFCSALFTCASLRFSKNSAFFSPSLVIRSGIPALLVGAASPSEAKEAMMSIEWTSFSDLFFFLPPFFLPPVPVNHESISASLPPFLFITTMPSTVLTPDPVAAWAGPASALVKVFR
mmetsp:Transcript_2997/g.7493  ORF Transcript_2997/g.7493 Transcript_2997/m.7493 type:complete len:216 (+) Transcript_2997:996-1643(+)